MDALEDTFTSFPSFLKDIYIYVYKEPVYLIF